MGREQELLYYVAVANGMQIVESHANGSDDLNRIAIDALKDVPEHSSHYSLGFDDTIFVFMRDKKNHDLVYMLVGHSVLTKEKAWKHLSDLRDSYWKQKSQKHRSVDGLKHHMQDLVKRVKDTIPPRVDLIVYPDAPRNYLVPKEGDEEPELVPLSRLSAPPGRKSLQEELAELGDSEDDEPIVDSPTKLSSGSGLRVASGAQAEGGSQPGSGGGAFNFLQAQSGFGKKSLAWSVEIKNAVPPVNMKSGLKQPTWSMELSAKNKQQHLQGQAHPPTEDEGPPSKDFDKPNHSLLSWAMKRGGPIPEVPLALGREQKSSSGSNDASPSYDSAEPSDRATDGGSEPDSVPLWGTSSVSSDEFQRRQQTGGQSGGSRKKGSPGGMIGYIQRSNSKSQEYPSKVSPEERFHPREIRTDVYRVHENEGFYSERSKPVAGRISAMAPSGLSWHEEIRRYNISMGLAAPKPFSGTLASPARDGTVSGMAAPTEQIVKKTTTPTSQGGSWPVRDNVHSTEPHNQVAVKRPQDTWKKADDMARSPSWAYCRAMGQKAKAVLTAIGTLGALRTPGGRIDSC